MSLFGAKKQTPISFKNTLKWAKENFEKRMEENSPFEASAVSSSHIGEQLERMGLLPTDPDGTATSSEIAREELGDYLGVQQEAVSLTREQFNQGVRIHNAEMRAEGHPSQVIELVWGENSVIDEYGNRRSHAVHTISSGSELSTPPPTTNYGGSEISFPSQTPRERVLSPLLSTKYEGSLMGVTGVLNPNNQYNSY